MDGARLTPLAFLLLLDGCRGKPPTVLPTYASDPQPYVAREGSGNAFDAYVLAAIDVERTVEPKDLTRTAFTLESRRKLIKSLTPAIQRLGRARGACDFQFVPVRLGDRPPYRAGWRLLGRTLRWQIDDAIETQNLPLALDRYALSQRFGNDLCGGDVSDRSLGAAIIEDGRLAILPILDKLDPNQLRFLSNATKTGLTRRPSLEQTLKNSERTVDLELQAVVDAIRTGDSHRFKDTFGKDGEDIAHALGRLLDDDSARTKFLGDLEADRKTFFAAWYKAAARPANDRDFIADLKLKSDREGKILARHFLLIGRPLFALEDRQVALLRLMVLEAELRRTVKGQGRAPGSLEGVKAPWVTDPYVGRPFGYLPDGSTFRIYSVGEDLKDDLGETDPDGRTPDLRIVVPM